MKKKILSLIVVSLLFGGGVFAQDNIQIKSFDELEAQCLERGRSSEDCALIESRCKEAGAMTADECYRGVNSEGKLIQPLILSLPDAGWTPDSPFYLLELITEEIVTFFNFGDVKKAERYANLAAERLAEAQAIAGKGRPGLTEKTLERYERQLNKSVERAKKAATKSKNAEKIIEVMSMVGEATSIHLEVLAEISEKVPQEDKGITEKAMEASVKGHKKAVDILQVKNALGNIPRDASLPTKIPKETRERIKQRAQKGLEDESLEILSNINSFKEIEDICLQGGGPPEYCANAKELCKEMYGADTPEECVSTSKSMFDAMPGPTMQLKPEIERGQEEGRQDSDTSGAPDVSGKVRIEQIEQGDGYKYIQTQDGTSIQFSK